MGNRVFVLKVLLLSTFRKKLGYRPLFVTRCVSEGFYFRSLAYASGYEQSGLAAGCKKHRRPAPKTGSSLKLLVLTQSH